MKKMGIAGMIIVGWIGVAEAYPPAVGIVSKAKNCLVCHANNGPWQEDARLVVDLLDGQTKASLKQPDGTFQIEVERGKSRTVLAVLGRTKGDPLPSPTRNGWLFIDPSRIAEEAPSAKFAKGWDVNQSLGCRMVGDPLPGYEGAALTVAPMVVRATEEAKAVELEWHAMLTNGEAVKGKAREGLRSMTYVKIVKLVVKEPAVEKSKSDNK